MNNRFNALVLGLMIGLAGILTTAFAPGAALEENLGLHWLFALRGPVDAPSDVIIIAIDEQSAQQLGLPDKPRDWPRNLHAQLVRYLAKAGARVISFDLTFDTASSPAANDQEFAAAMGEARNVLITDSLRKETIRILSPNGKPIGSVLIEKPAPPIAVFENAVLGHAPFLLPKGSRVNAYWTFRNGAGDAPTLPVLAFHVFARDAFDDLLALLRKADPSASLPAPASSAPMAVAENGLNTVGAVRDALLKDPQIRERILQQLHELPNQEMGQERRRRIESLVNLYSSSETSYLNFYGPPRSIETIAYSRVLGAARSIGAAGADGLDASLFKNKAVFVGFSAASEAGQDRLRDDYRTVYSQSNGLDISGVEIAATAFANVLEGRPLRPAAPAWQFAIVGAWGLLLGVLCRSIRPIRAVAVVGALSAVFLALVYQQFVDASQWWPSIIPVAVQAPLALFAGVWLNGRDTQREREAMKQAFGQFLPGTVVDQLARNVGPVTARNRVVFGACLATDAEKYTALAEQMEPGKLGELMNDYYAKLFAPVERSGGVVIDVVGDAMVAIWAGAMSDAELRINACQSALGIVEALNRADQIASGNPGLPTRLGLHSGEMLVGSVGASRHFEYRAVGDIVNTASRIQGLNKILGTRLLASEATVDGLEQFATRPLGSFLMAGKSTAVSLVELLGPRKGIDPHLSNLCEVFSGALDAYRVQKWRDAADRFETILRSVPDDGPARFYLVRCDHLLLNPPDADWTPTIRIDAK